MNILRGIAVVFGALILAFAGVVGVELVSSVLHPFPPGVDPNDIEVCRTHVSNYPTGVLLLCAAGWWLTFFVSCWMATRLGAGRHPVHGIVVGAILVALALFNMSMLPYPAWFWVNLIIFPACCFGGIWLARRGQNQKTVLKNS